jgi:hypothetical protein
MKNTLRIIVAMLFFAANMNAQTFSKGNLLVTADFQLSTGTNLIGHLEYGLTDQIGIGGGLWYTSFFGGSNTEIFGRVSYHLNNVINVDKFDFMASSEVYFTADQLGIAILPGARYYFTDKIAAHAEFGIGIVGFSGAGYNDLRLGATFRL